MGRFSISPRTADAVSALRSDMAARVRQIEGWLSPAGESLAASEVASIFAVMAVKGMGDGEADAMMAVYVADLSDLPYFALAGACKRFRKGEIGDGKWAPTPGEICQEAQRLLDAPLAEKFDLTAILSAEVQSPQVSPERKAELLAEKDALLASLRFSGKVEPPAIDVRAVPEPARKKTICETIMADLEQKRADYAASPVSLSDAALLACGVTPPSRDEMRKVI